MTAKERSFTEKFSAKENPFKLSIARLIPPKGGDESTPPDAFLLKLKYVVSLELASEEDRELFHSFVRRLEQTKTFCGVWTPEFSEPYIDQAEASVELTSYLRKGMEDKILYLDELARASMEPKPSTDDQVLVEHFMLQLRKGAPLKEAALTAEKETMELLSHGRRAETEIESDSLAAGTRLEPRSPVRTKVHRPPPGPPLQRGGAPAPDDRLAPVPRAEEPPPTNELQEALQLASKEKDSELEISPDTHFEINLDRKRERKAG